MIDGKGGDCHSVVQTQRHCDVRHEIETRRHFDFDMTYPKLFELQNGSSHDIMSIKGQFFMTSLGPANQYEGQNGC